MLHPKVAFCFEIVLSFFCFLLFRIRVTNNNPNSLLSHLLHNQKGRLRIRDLSFSKTSNSGSCSLSEIFFIIFRHENYENDVLFKVTQACSEKGNPSAPIRSRLQITSSDALATPGLYHDISHKEYRCFDKGCPNNAHKRTRQCRKVVWEILNKF